MPYLWIILFGNLVAAQESNTAQGGPYVYPIGNNTLLYFVSSTITLIGPERTIVPVEFGPQPTSDFTNTFGKIVIPGSGGEAINSLEVSLFVQLLPGQYWTLSNITLTAEGNVKGSSFNFQNTEMLRPYEPTSPLHMSYHCTKFGPWVTKEDPQTKATNTSFTAVLEFKGFQMESFMKNNSKFGPSYDCIGFFSIGILSGWFVTIILLGILTWGITMVMSVNTMDRFDDPKSKPIAVGTSE